MISSFNFYTSLPHGVLLPLAIWVPCEAPLKLPFNAFLRKALYFIEQSRESCLCSSRVLAHGNQQALSLVPVRMLPGIKKLFMLVSL